MLRPIYAAALLSGVTAVHATATALSPIIVTASRTAETADESLASVTVIDREQIEQQQPARFTDLLTGRTGINVSDNGPFGKASSLYMRGTNPDHTLLLIDGVRIGSATTGGASWQFLPPSEIDRIEIVRGPRASIYGADAIGGVVQVFTRSGAEGPPRFDAQGRVGEFGTREFSAGIQGGSARTDYSLSASHQESDGIDVRENAGDEDADGYRNTSLSTQFAHRLDSGAELFASWLRSSGRTEFDMTAGGEDYTDFLQQAARAGVRGDVAPALTSELSFSYSTDENEDTYNPSWFGDSKAVFDTKRSGIEWRNDLTLGPATLLTVGLDWYEDRITSTTEYEENRRDNIAVYQILQSDMGRHSLQGSLRHDDNEAYGGETTGQVAWGYAVNNHLRSRLSYGTAFKAPTFNDLYWPYGGNPDLEPERSESVEGGLRYQQGALHWEASLYQTEVDDLIAWACSINCEDGDWSTDIWLPQNVAQARIRGLELETGLRHNDWSALLSLSLLDTENRESGNELVQRPAETLRLDLDRRVQRFRIGGSIIARSHSYNDDANTERLAGYALLNLRASWRMASDWSLRLTLDNALDKHYETAGGYNQPGRAAYASLHYHPGRQL